MPNDLFDTPLFGLQNFGKMEAGRRKPVGLFMAFGTKGDVHPIAAIAAAFSYDQQQYDVNFVTHSAHEKLMAHLLAKNIKCFRVSSPPVLPLYEETSGRQELSFSMQKRMATKEHRKECVSIFETIFGDTPSMEGDFVVINFFALEGWSLAELFHVRCVLAAPYVVPYSAPSSFERCFRKELPLLYGYLKEAPAGKVSWKDVMHWMWPLFTENWGSWRSSDLHMSTWPFTDPVTGLPMWHDRSPSPLLLYGFSKEVVECPGYWPSNVRVCGSWSLPLPWQFSCGKCGQNSALASECLQTENKLCPDHAELQSFLSAPWSVRPIFVGLGSIASMGFLSIPQAFVQVLESVTKVTSYRFILFSDGYEPLDQAIFKIASGESSSLEHKHLSQNEISLFNGRIFCFFGSIPYDWLFPRCEAAVHHGGSGTTVAALRAGIPQVICPFILDQFYWAERMFWLGVAPEPLKRNHLLPDNGLELSIGESASALLRAIKVALSPDIKAQALEVAKRISLEDGVYQAVKTLKDEIAKTTTSS